MKLQAMAARRRSAWRSLQKGDRLDLGGVELRVHHPPLPDWERQKVSNDDSLVIELRYGQVSMLLTGDIGREVEQALLPTLDLLPIVVLKSPHHGSGTSSSQEFIDAIKPRVVVISCGRAQSVRSSAAVRARSIPMLSAQRLPHRSGRADRGDHGRHVAASATYRRAVIRHARCAGRCSRSKRSSEPWQSSYRKWSGGSESRLFEPSSAGRVAPRARCAERHFPGETRATEEIPARA